MNPRWLIPVLLCATAVALAPAAAAESGNSSPDSPSARPVTKFCKPVVNPYAGTRYGGVNLSKIRATGVVCGVARHVAREAHRKALEQPLPASGLRHLTWHGWKVTGDLRPSSDVYVATLGAKQVRWRF